MVVCTPPIVLPENSIQPFSTQCNIVTSWSPDQRGLSFIFLNVAISKVFAPDSILARDKVTILRFTPTVLIRQIRELALHSGFIHGYNSHEGEATQCAV